MRVCTIHPDDAGEDGRSRGGYEKWACRRLRPSAVSRTGSCLPVRVASRSMPSCTLIRDRDGMIRTRIQLTEEQARALEAQARMEERSMAERVRECVARRFESGAGRVPVRVAHFIITRFCVRGGRSPNHVDGPWVQRRKPPEAAQRRTFA